jgi:fatty-acyl-CoA synthase
MHMSTSAADWIAHHARVSPNREAVHDLASGRRYSYAQLDERVTRLALYLRSLNVGEGDRVAALSHNDSDVFEIEFACQRLGAIFLPLNWRLAVPELEFICNDAAPKVLVHGVEFAAEAANVAGLSGIPKTIEMANGGDSAYESGIAAASGDLALRTNALDDTWVIMYTSGTTGRPKGAMITYGMCLFNGIHSIMDAELTQRSKNLVFLPMFHTAGLNVFGNPIFQTGACNVIMRAFDPAEFLSIITDKDIFITHALGVPTNFLMLAEVPGFDAADFSNLVSLSVGGAAAPLALIERFGAKGVRLQQAWGMTETGPLGLWLTDDKALEKVGSSGLPPMFTDLKIVEEDGSETPRGQTGELLIRGPNVLPGYWNRPEANKEIFTEDGFFHTGDAARQDEDGYYYIVDRWKDMFISGGENVYPVEVENVIFQLDGVLENAVIGIPHEKWGEVGRAYVVLKEGVNLDEQAVTDHCRSQLATYKVPKEVRMIDELPHNATGKVLKHELPRD